MRTPDGERFVIFGATWTEPDRSIGQPFGFWEIEDVRFHDGSHVPDELLTPEVLGELETFVNERMAEREQSAFDSAVDSTILAVKEGEMGTTQARARLSSRSHRLGIARAARRFCRAFGSFTRDGRSRPRRSRR